MAWCTWCASAGSRQHAQHGMVCIRRRQPAHSMAQSKKRGTLQASEPCGPTSGGTCGNRYTSTEHIPTQHQTPALAPPSSSDMMSESLLSSGSPAPPAAAAALPRLLRCLFSRRLPPPPPPAAAPSSPPLLPPSSSSPSSSNHSSSLSSNIESLLLPAFLPRLPLPAPAAVFEERRLRGSVLCLRCLPPAAPAAGMPPDAAPRQKLLGSLRASLSCMQAMRRD
jgi:hypothetical protein